MRGKFDSDLASSVFTEDREGARERTLRYLDQMRARLGDGVLLVPSSTCCRMAVPSSLRICSPASI